MRHGMARVVFELIDVCGDGAERLVHLAGDPFETCNLAASKIGNMKTLCHGKFAFLIAPAKPRSTIVASFWTA